MTAILTLLLAACGDDGGGDDGGGGEAGAAGVRHLELTPEQIETYQADLDAVGCWAGPVDGLLGPRTEAALREFQEAEGIPVTGLFGGGAAEALEAAAQAGETVCAGGDGETAAPRPVDEASLHEIEVWQHDLNAVGCWAGPEDGTLGPQTEAAIRGFQTNAGLAVDGRIGPETESALAEAAAEGAQVCHAPASGGTAGHADAPDDGGGALDGAADCQVNSGGQWPTRADAQAYVAQLESAGITGFGVLRAQPFVVARTGLTRRDGGQLSLQLQQAGFSARLYCEA